MRTPYEEAQLARARELAREKNIRVLAVGRDKQSGEIVGFVTNSYSSPTSMHIVRVYTNALRCDCPRSDPERGNSVCSHRAVCHDWLLAAREQQKRSVSGIVGYTKAIHLSRAIFDKRPISIWP